MGRLGRERDGRAILRSTSMNYGDLGSTLVYDGSIIIRHDMSMYTSHVTVNLHYSANSFGCLTRVIRLNMKNYANMNLSIMSSVL